MILLIKLLLAHIIGDFFMQSQKWVTDKENRKLKSPILYVHIAIHIALLFIILWDITMWSIILIIGATHLIIDGLKLVLQRESNRRWLFFVDQLLHILVIVSVYYLYTDNTFSIDELLTENILLLLTCLMFITQPVSIIMQTIFTKWDITKLTENNESLSDAGKYIGILERLLVFVFIIANHWEAVGFLITAKSVFRFGDLKESKHRKLTEYIHNGTLISFGIAIAVGLIFKSLV